MAQRLSAKLLIEELDSSWLLENRGFQYRLQDETCYVLITCNGNFFTGTCLDYIKKIADKFEFNFIGIGLNLDDKVEIQLDPR